MNDILAKIKTNLTDKLPPNISKLLYEAIELSEQGNYTESLKSLSECLFLLLREEYFTPAGLVYDNSMGMVDMLRELRSNGKDLGKSETDAILRIHEKAKLEEVDAIVMETCFEGAIVVFESYLREQESKQQKRAEASNRKSPGRFIMEELETLFIESDSDKKIREHLPKIEEIYQDFPYNKEIRKIYLQFLSLVDKERSKKEILRYMESGEVTIHLGSVCIMLLAEMGFLYDAKKMLDWYDSEFSGEKDGVFTELFVYLHSYLKDGREAEKRRAEGLSDIFGSRKESFYTYIENCYLLFSEREDAIRQKSEGLYLYKENVFREKCMKRAKEELAERELKRLEDEREKAAQNSRVTSESIIKEVAQSEKVLPIDHYQKSESKQNGVNPEKNKDSEIIEKKEGMSPIKKMIALIVFLLFLVAWYFTDKSNSTKEIPENELSSNITSEKKGDGENSIWGPYIGDMRWEDANEKCKYKGMRLPTLEELKNKYKLEKLEEWKINGNYYWSSTQYDMDKYYALSVYTGYSNSYARTFYYSVRCHR